jgi:uncharacterized protein YjbI with pentapeptide repeats
LGTNLTNIDMTGAAIDNARLSNTNLTGTFATGTKFNGTIIDGADFTDMLLRKDVLKFLCATATGTNPTTGDKARETLNCPQILGLDYLN